MNKLLNRSALCLNLILTAGALLACFALLCSCACVSPSPSGDSGNSGWKPPYFEMTGFTNEDGRFYYEADGVAASCTGVDVSENQGWIDWEAVSEDGIEFAMVRAGYRGTTEGGLFVDELYEYNLSAAHEAGIDCGVYFFSQAITEEEAREEAEYVLSLLDGVYLEYPVAFDYEQNAAGIESRIAGISPEEATRIAQAFCSVIEEGGYDAMVYGNAYDLDYFDMDALSEYSLWYAEYGTPPASRRPFMLWQYSNEGWVYGIDTAVDLNLDMSSAL